MTTQNQAVARVEHHALVGVNIESLLAKAVDAKAAVEVLERLQAMRKEMMAEQAQREFQSAMANFQSECPIITKRKMGAKNAYRYAPLDHIVAETKQLIKDNGFSFSITSEVEKGWVKAVCKVSHEAGHHETAEFKAPVDERNPMMTDPQKYGAAMTFAKRYAFCAAFGILTADEDTDGSGLKAKLDEPNERQTLATELWNVLKTVRGEKKEGEKSNWDKANEWLWREDILDAAAQEAAPKLSVEKLKQAITKAKQKLA